MRLVPWLKMCHFTYTFYIYNKLDFTQNVTYDLLAFTWRGGSWPSSNIPSTSRWFCFVFFLHQCTCKLCKLWLKQWWTCYDIHHFTESRQQSRICNDITLNLTIFILFILNFSMFLFIFLHVLAGILFACAATGPVFGYVLSALTLSYHVDFDRYTAPITITPSDAGWVRD